ncbi:MAG: beta-lactamase family protein [Planctomycetes bacterium]|nr:beta-lactamase family protein [Planctomycetota bacterium]
MIRSALASVLLLLGWASWGQADEVNWPCEIADTLEPIRAKHDLPALAGAIVTSRGMLGAAVVGVRKRGETTPVAVDDRWHMGSCTKAMTATMIGRLVEQGKLRWDTTVESMFPEAAAELPAELRQVTLRQLLSHRAGLSGNLPWGSFRREQTRAERQADVLVRLTPLYMNSKPGTKWEYSNTGYVLAGMMAERAANQDWQTLMQELVFEPLGVKRAEFAAPNSPGFADPWPHTSAGVPIGGKSSVRLRKAWNEGFKSLVTAAKDELNNQALAGLLGPDGEAPVAAPAGSVLRLSLDDWGKFVADHLRGERGEPALLKPETYRVLHNQLEGGGDIKALGDGQYALGWVIVERPWAGGRALSHSGSNGYNFCVVWIGVKRDLAVLVCTNQPTPGTDATAGALIRLFDKHFSLQEKVKAVSELK